MCVGVIEMVRLVWYYACIESYQYLRYASRELFSASLDRYIPFIIIIYFCFIIIIIIITIINVIVMI
jgi:hypothetical protein